MPKSEPKKGKLILEDNSVFEGFSFGATHSTSGEVVFHTGMFAFPENLTDPSYREQILLLTYPLVGNYGIPSNNTEKERFKYFESGRIHAKGLLVSEYSREYSHWNAAKSLQEWLLEEKVPALCGIDSRALTQHLRDKGTMPGKIVIGEEDVSFSDKREENLVKEASVAEPKTYGNGEKTIALIDCGAANSVVHSLLHRKFSVWKVPWNFDLLSSGKKFDAVVVAGGPGNPAAVKETIESIQKILEEEIPLMAISLGNELLAKAIGAELQKLPFGHRSQNQPSILHGTKKCFVTTQNHSFAIKAKTLPSEWLPWFENANDKTLEGIRHKTKPFLGVEFNPQPCLHELDTTFIWDNFLGLVK